MKLSKSKLALAKIINENGGWQERALWAVQDNCIAFFLGGKPEYKSGDRCWYSNSIDGACVGTITCDEKVTNWHQTILSREEYYHAYPKADADGWIEWNGGECPVYGDDDVDVVLVDGSTDHGIADEFDWHRDGGPLSVASYRLRNANVGGWINWNGGECPVGDGVLIDVKKVDGSTEFAVHDPQDRIWCDTDHRKCIIAYRLHKPEVKPEFCESVMRSIQDPESKPTIEQLAQDYRNKLDFAKRKQQEADEANAAADAALGELERAGEALGLLIGIAKPDREPELVITDWRHLQKGDIVWWSGDYKYSSGEYQVHDIEEHYHTGSCAILLDVGGCCRQWIDHEEEEWRFIRRP